MSYFVRSLSNGVSFGVLASSESNGCSFAADPQCGDRFSKGLAWSE